MYLAGDYCAFGSIESNGTKSSVYKQNQSQADDGLVFQGFEEIEFQKEQSVDSNHRSQGQMEGQGGQSG